MQPRHYLLILRKRWLIALFAFLATSLTTVYLVSQQPSIYESNATFVVRPRSASAGTGGVADDTLRATDTLIRGVEINTTYATIVRSDRIKDRAEERLGPDVDTSGASVSSKVITETNILEISVSGPDPETARALTEAVGLETVEYVSELQYVFELEPLDPPTASSSPVAPNRPLTIATGIVFGVALAVGTALVTEALSRSPASARLDAQVVSALLSNRSYDADYDDLEPDHPTTSFGHDPGGDDLDRDHRIRTGNTRAPRSRVGHPPMGDR